mmetsp:Transcript_20768/g.30915  ORF Transcript_20768/g.30915 Transcript_20768/m.30915 type:complete len:140 (-) Transcript_20768:2-421(-)
MNTTKSTTTQQQLLVSLFVQEAEQRKALIRQSGKEMIDALSDQKEALLFSIPDQLLAMPVAEIQERFGGDLNAAHLAISGLDSANLQKENNEKENNTISQQSAAQQEQYEKLGEMLTNIASTQQLDDVLATFQKTVDNY